MKTTNRFLFGTQYQAMLTPEEREWKFIVNKKGILLMQDFSKESYFIGEISKDKTKPCKGKVVSDKESLLKDFGITVTKELSEFLEEAETEIALENRVKSIVCKALA